MNEIKHSPLPWELLIGKEFCLHDTCRVAIVRPITLEDGTESSETVAEVWPGDNNIDIKDGEFIVRACNCHEELVKACRDLLFLANNAHNVKADPEQFVTFLKAAEEDARKALDKLK